MRILHVVTLVSPDGAYGGPLRVAMNQATELRNRGHAVTIAAGWLGKQPPPQHVGGVPAVLFRARNVIPRFGFAGLVSIRLLWWLWRHARDYHVVHVHAARDLLPLTATAVAAIQRRPYVTQTHGMIVPDHRIPARVLDAVATRRLLGAAARNFVLTRLEQQQVAEVLGRPDGIQLLGNGVPAPVTRPRVSRRDEVLFCARLHPRKHVLRFVEMAKNILAAGYDVDFCIVGPDGGDLPALHAELQRVDTGRIRYEGALPYEAVAERIAQATIYVLPSVDEPYPMSLLEALSFAVPSVCTDSCGLAEELRRHGAAVVSQPDVESLTAAVRGLLDHPDERRRLADAAARSARKIYSIAGVCDSIEDAYTAAAARQASAASRF